MAANEDSSWRTRLHTGPVTGTEILIAYVAGDVISGTDKRQLVVEYPLAGAAEALTEAQQMSALAALATDATVN